MKLNKYIDKLGYKSNLSDGEFLKFEKALLKYLQNDDYEKFCHLRETASSEEEITKFIGDDLDLLRLVLSAQIKISITLTERIVYYLKNKKFQPKSILDLGGAEGWAANFISDQLKTDSLINVVEKNNIFPAFNEETIIHNTTYELYKSNTKHDLIISILGAPFEKLEELISCISKALNKNGMVFLGLRIASVSDYIKTIDIANSNNLIFNSELSERIKIFNENIPLICLTQSTKNQSVNDKLILSRKCFFNLSNPKRIFGFEADLFEKNIQGKLIVKDFIEFSDRSKLYMEVIEFNEVIYRKTYNTHGDKLIEFPVHKNDELNDIHNQLDRMSTEDLWSNTL